MNLRLNIHSIVNLINNQYKISIKINKQKCVEKNVYRRNCSKCAAHPTEPIFPSDNCGVMFKILQPMIYK